MVQRQTSSHPHGCLAQIFRKQKACRRKTGTALLMRRANELLGHSNNLRHHLHQLVPPSVHLRITTPQRERVQMSMVRIRG